MGWLGLCRFCGFARHHQTLDEIKDSILLVHWGLKATEVACDLHQRLTSFNDCPMRAAVDNKPGHLPCFNPQKACHLDTLMPVLADYLVPASV